MNILSEIWSSLSRNRFRTAMTGFAVAWGIFMLMVLLGASSGFEHGLRGIVQGQIQNKVTIWRGWTSLPYKGLPVDRLTLFGERDLLRLRSLPFVNEFSAVTNMTQTVNIGDHYTNAQVKGVEPVFGQIYDIELSQGRFLNPMDEKDKRKVCVVDEAVINELGGEDLFGKYLQIAGLNYLVIGVCPVSSGRFSSTGIVYIPLATYDALLSTTHQYDHVVFSVDDSYYEHHTPDDLDSTLRHLLGPSMLFDEKDDRAVYIDNDKKGSEDLEKVIYGLRMFILIVGWLMLVSGAVGVSNIMLVSVRERTKEFGIRKAIGAPPRTILMTVLGESLLITILFGLIGVYFGALTIALVDTFVPPAQFFQRPTVDAGMVWIALVTLTVVGVLAGLTPAIRAVRIKPIEALNYEK